MPSVPVLVVEDDESTRAAVRALLEDSGYAVADMASFAAALAALAAPDARYVVLFDYLVPPDDGGTLLRWIAAAPDAARRHGFICMTASPNLPGDRYPGQLEQFGIPVVAKPFGIDALLATVEQTEAALLAREARVARAAGRARRPRGGAG